MRIIRIYGAAGHGKSEVDSCGDHLKNPPRDFAMGNILRSANDVCLHLANKYELDKYQNPMYCPRVISKKELEVEPEKRRYMQFDTVEGSDSFHVLVFRPNYDFFLASKRLCVCNDCMSMNFENCANFKKYIPSVGKLLKKQLRSASVQETSRNDGKVTIVANTVVAILADSQSENFFLIMCDEDEKIHNDPQNPLIDNSNHKIYDGHCYIKGRYLEYKSMNNKCYTYTISRSSVYVHKDSIFFPYVPVIDTTKSSIKILNEVILELQVRSVL